MIFFLWNIIYILLVKFEIFRCMGASCIYIGTEAAAASPWLRKEHDIDQPTRRQSAKCKYANVQQAKLARIWGEWSTHTLTEEPHPHCCLFLAACNVHPFPPMPAGINALSSAGGGAFVPACWWLKERAGPPFASHVYCGPVVWSRSSSPRPMIWRILAVGSRADGGHDTGF